MSVMPTKPKTTKMISFFINKIIGTQQTRDDERMFSVDASKGGSSMQTSCTNNVERCAFDLLLRPSSLERAHSTRLMIMLWDGQIR
jgi:hypothetical protein